MAYIGKSPALGNFVKLDAISVVNGQAAYTMQNGSVNFTDYSTVNQFLVSLNGTIQSAGSSFTVSSSTITFSSNLSTGDVIDFIIVFGNSLSAGTVSDSAITTAKLASTSVTAAKLNNDIISGTTALTSEPADTDEFLVSDAGTLKRIDYSLIKGGGITMADQFCLTSGFSGSATPIASNLARVARTGQGTINGGMTESSGIFTFPSTGIYLVNFTASFQYNGDSRYIFITMQATTDNSTYSAVAETPTFIQETSGSTTYAQAQCSSLIDVTDTSNVKVRFFVSPLNASVTTRGEAVSATYMQFIRLGDT